MKMFRMGLENGKPKKGQTGVQPEWFYKGNGIMLTGPGRPLISPAFADDAGEEPEIAGISCIGPGWRAFPYRFCARQRILRSRDGARQLSLILPIPNYARVRSALNSSPATCLQISGVRHVSCAKTRPFGKSHSCPAKTTCPTPSQISNIIISNMLSSASRATSMCICSVRQRSSFADGVKAENGDVFEIEAPAFGLPLRNPLKIGKALESESDSAVS